MVGFRELYVSEKEEDETINSLQMCILKPKKLLLYVEMESFYKMMMCSAFYEL